MFTFVGFRAAGLKKVHSFMFRFVGFRAADLKKVNRLHDTSFWCSEQNDITKIKVRISRNNFLISNFHIVT